MEVTLIASFFGFLASLVPESMKLYQERKDREHELAIMEKQLQQQATGHSQRLEEVRIRAEAIESRALYRTYQTGIRWVDAFNGTVRPALAYAFFILYAGVKSTQLHYFGETIAGPFDKVLLLWNAEDQAIFAAIISFYFGQRAIQRAKG